MKRIFQHPTGPDNGRAYWRSLDQLENSPEFREALEREFPAGAQELVTDGLSRRAFLRLMGASVALAGVGLSSCRRPELYAVPYTNSPEWIIAGKAIQYATAMPRRAGAIPLLVTTYEGRPTHLAGNHHFPDGFGGLDVKGQASILDLYDPDRARTFKHLGKDIGLAQFAEKIKAVATEYATKDGAGLALVFEPSRSPTRERLLQELAAKLPKAFLAEYDPIPSGMWTSQTSGARLRPMFAEADVIFSLGSDFLTGEEFGVQAVRQFAARRRVKKPGDKMNRLYVVESRLTTTGGMADHRLAVPIGQHAAFLQLVIKALVAQGASGLAYLLPALTLPESFTAAQKKWAEEFAVDLAQSPNPLLVTGADQSPLVKALVVTINEKLGSFGKTIYFESPFSKGSYASLTDLREKLKTAGAIETLITVGVNPAYNSPFSETWAELIKEVPHTIHLGHGEDETATVTQWSAPLAHYLESWGDNRAENGTYLTAQPLILPLFGGVSEIELLAALLGQDQSLQPYVYPKPAELAKPHLPGQSTVPLPYGLKLVKETFSKIYSGNNLESAWNKALHDGYWGDSGKRGDGGNLPGADLIEMLRQATPPAEGLEVTFYPCPKVDDGRYANNGWLQELPDTITKLNWDNAALVSVATAKRLGIEKSGEVRQIESSQGTLQIPFLISPGQADNSIAIALGYGRTHAGNVGNKVGFNAYPLSKGSFCLTGVKVTKLSREKIHPLAITQNNGSMEGRGLVREATLAQYEQEPDFAKKMHMDGHAPSGFSIYKHPDSAPEKGPGYKEPVSKGPHQWGMVLDLSTCVGCNACTIACQSENNIPIVGKEQVMNTRMMQWIRVDRYYSESPEDPQIAVQPVLCQHCENAPCEAVCPVNATVHTDEGLNIIAYNRCIGTRYCMNNCPYKVRRFNYFDYNARDVLSKTKIGPIELGNLYLGPLGKEGSPDTAQLQRNPNVTVRVRGVVEKCSFCVQRIEEARNEALIAARDSNKTAIKPDTFQTACQVACPAEAIVFGDISNPQSEVSKLRGTDREYALLGYLNTAPRVTYLARLRNPNLKMPGAEKIGWGSDWDKVGPYGNQDGHEAHDKAHAPATGGHH